MPTESFEKEDWIDVGKSINRSSLKQEILEAHLACKADDMVVVSTILSLYQQVVQLAILDEYLAKVGLTVSRTFDLETGHVAPLGYREVELDKDLVIRVVEDGYMMLNGEFNLVLQISEWHVPDQWKIRIFARSDNHAKALSFLKDLRDYSSEHNVLKGKKISPSLDPIGFNESYSWDSVILPEATKAELISNINLLFDNIDIYRKNKTPFKRGLILKGEPGTGKTLIGKVLCNILKDVTFIWVTPEHFRRIGAVGSVCEMARSLAPSVLFLEDVDLFGEQRERSSDKFVLGELMNQLDGIVENEYIVVIATTNRVEDLEDALRNRPGRFDRVIDIGKPDLDCRRRMLEIYLADRNLEVKDKEGFFKMLANKTDGFTGAHMKELINTAIISAIDQRSVDQNKQVILKPSHFINNVEKVKSKKISPVMGFSAVTKQVNYDDPEYDWDDCSDCVDRGDSKFGPPKALVVPPASPAQWRCGKCEGADLPKHFRLCPKRDSDG